MKQIIDKYADGGFSYGALDCCQFAGECIEHLTGENPMQKFQYANKVEAYRIINGFGSLDEAITATLGEGVQGEYEPKDGDVALFKSTNGLELVGVVYRSVAIVLTQSGIMDWPISRAHKVWVT